MINLPNNDGCELRGPYTRFALVLFLAVAGVEVVMAAETYESCFLYYGRHPDEEGTPFADEFQGLTHDDDNWFLSSNTGKNTSIQMGSISPLESLNYGKFRSRTTYGTSRATTLAYSVRKSLKHLWPQMDTIISGISATTNTVTMDM
jgi:hypothetical protein